MSMFLALAFLFFIGSVFGWVIEVLYRRFLSSSNPKHKWINPGFCTGPYLPLYGCGLCLMYLISSLEQYRFLADPFWNKVVLLFVIAIAMTAIEYIAGICSLKFVNVRLWDYSGLWGNIQGIICPLFSCIWAVLGTIYYFLIHPHILDALHWLSQNLTFSFVIGLFFGVFLVDVAYSLELTAKLKKYAQENEVIIRFEAVKEHIRNTQVRNAQRVSFFRPFKTELPLREHLNELRATFENKRPKNGSGSSDQKTI